MLAIYIPQSAEGFELCHPVRHEDFETLFAALNGSSRWSTWQSPPMRLVSQERGRPLAESDCPWLGKHALVFRRPAIAALEPMLHEYGELLPLACPDADLAIYNVTRMIDALDEEASSVIRFSNGRVMRIPRYAFMSELVRGVDIFKIPCLRVSPTFVSEDFVKLWQKNGLRGLVFNQVWSA